MSSGLSKIEDFCPISDSEALCVNGQSYTELTEIVKVRYNDRLELSEPETIKTGSYLRLGNYYDGELCYSDVYDVFIGDEKICEGIQPYAFDLGIVYQNHGSIYLNKEKIISPYEDYKVCGRPTEYNNQIYYETRCDIAPKGWEIWRYDIESNTNEFIIRGANPYVYKNTLYYSLWNGSEFDLCTYKI